jgi:subtilisin family serine protease
MLSMDSSYHSNPPKIVSRLVIVVLAILVALGGWLPDAPALAQTDNDKTRVIVIMRESGEQRMNTQTEQPAFDRSDPDTTVLHTYKHLPAVAIETTTAKLESLRAHPEVATVIPDLTVQIAATNTPATFMQADIVRETLGITGEGVTIAILDTGIDTDHPDLAPQIIAEQCFNKDESCPPEKTAQGDSAEDENGHGTHVAGIIAGQGRESPLGLAPGANLVPIRVLNSQGTGYTSDVLAGIEWVIEHQVEYNIRVINLSLGGGSYSGVCDDMDDTARLYATAANAAREAGIVLFAASGNKGDAANLLVPACVSGVVAIGNGYHTPLPQMAWPTCSDTDVIAGQIACSSNSNSALTLLAPGTLIQAAALGGGQVTHSGTSMAAPHAAAVAGLLLEAAPDLSPDETENTLIQTGTATEDSRNGQPLVFINALAAIQATITPTEVTTITGTVLLQGRQEHGGTAIYTDSDDCLVTGASSLTPDTFTDQSGDFTLSVVEGQLPGCLWAAQPGYLSIRSNTLTAPTVTLLAGDVNQDQAINILDLALIAQNYKTNSELADIDASGIVDIIDLTWAGLNFNQQGPLLWTD